MSKVTTKQEETLFQKEKRLKARRKTFIVKYKTGVFYNTWDHSELKKYLDQPDVLVRVHSGGSMDDNTSFIQITIEGFTPSDNGL